MRSGGVPQPLRMVVGAAAVVFGGMLTLSLASSLTIRTLRFAAESKRKKVALPCVVCKGKGFYICKLCKGNSTIQWSPLYDPLVINPCLCPTCDGNSTADLESEPGLFLSNKEKVFSEAKEMALKYRQKLPAVSATRKLEPLPNTILFDDEASLYANWRWFKFKRDNKPN